MSKKGTGYFSDAPFRNGGLPALPRVIVITDWSMGREALLERVASALSAGPAVAVQHRHPGAPDRLFLDEARSLASLCARGGNPLFVNGRPDIALLVAAHLHLPSRSFLPQDVRPHLPPERLISVAVHDEAEADELAAADLALISPVFAPGSKPDDTRSPLGLEGFRRLAARFGRPAFALGGVTPENAPSIPAAGVAVVSSVLRAKDPAAAARSLIASTREPGAPAGTLTP